MPPVRMRGDGRKAKDPKKTFLRLLGYMKKYWLHLTLVLLSILLSALANTKGSENVGTLVDDYILPLVGVENPDYGPLVGYILQLGLIFGLGILGSFLNQYLMVPVSQGTQRVASVQDADMILVMDGGAVVDMGDHATLLQRCSIYREVFESQRKGDIQ